MAIQEHNVLQKQLIDDILNCLKYDYVVDGKSVKGISVSDLLSSLRGTSLRGSCHCTDENGKLRMWRIPGNLADFEYLLQNAGFEVEYGRNLRGNRARVVYL